MSHHAEPTPDYERTTITVEYHDKRLLATGHGEIGLIAVKSGDGGHLTAVVTPDRDPVPTVEGSMTLENVIAAGSLPDADVDTQCPACHGPLRKAHILDTFGAAVRSASLAADGDRYLVIDSATVVSQGDGPPQRVDDWQYRSREERVATGFVCVDCHRSFSWHDIHPGPAADHLQRNKSMAAAAEPTVGLAAGGAKDIDNFRENITNGYTPQPSAISDEGLFYDYYFETGDRTETDALFAPRYAAAVTDHPITGETERYLSVGLDSTVAVSEFERPPLDLVAILDISGSMGSPFDEYYYDEHGHRRESGADATRKMTAAAESLCALTQHLDGGDRLGIVLYNSTAQVAKPVRDVGSTDMAAIRGHIREVSAGGGTDLSAGFEAGADLLRNIETDAEREQRLVFLTDMMPNTGRTDSGDLTDLFADAADEGIHTTFIGMGLDANADLVDTLAGIRGANHYFVHSADEFDRRLGEEFEYMVSPLVYDLELTLETEGYQVAAVHGSPSASPSDGQLLDVGTLFPSAKDDGEARGGIVLARLDRTSPGGEVALLASWTERDGSDHTERVTVELPNEPETFAHDGVRKAVALARYARELRSWTRGVHGDRGVDDWQGPGRRGEHERESVPLAVPERYVDRFGTIREYLAAEREALGDESLGQEIELLETLIATPDSAATAPQASEP